MRAGDGIHVRVTAVEQITPLIRRFTFEHADGGSLPRFSGGSHVVVEMQGAGRTHRNPYSLMSAPDETRYYQVGVRRVDEGRGGSRFMHEQVATGTVLRISEPVNLFPLVRTRRKHVLLAGGIGITPFFAHIAELQCLGVDYELHYAVRDASHAGFAADLQRLAGDSLHLYLEAEGQSIDMGAVLRGQPLGTDVYVCGPAGMIEATRTAARAAGWADSHVHWEQFTTPPAGEPFDVELAHSKLKVHVGPDISLLEAIEAAGVDAPSLCRGGVCGQCELEVLALDGELQHNDHYLSPEERAGCKKIMPCVSRARCQQLVLAL